MKLRTETKKNANHENTKFGKHERNHFDRIYRIDGIPKRRSRYSG